MPDSHGSTSTIGVVPAAVRAAGAAPAPTSTSWGARSSRKKRYSGSV